MNNKEKIRILFQGDSVTDVGRSRDNDQYRGGGYPTVVSGALNLDYPGKYCFFNRGVSGNRVSDLYARWRIDCVNLEPDVISILIGVNDVWHEVSRRNGVCTEKYEKIYNLLLDETQEELPGVKLMILEPFVLKGTATEENWDIFHDEVALRAAAAKRVAEKQHAVFVPLQAEFDRLCADGTPSSEWLIDGVHPTAAGHTLIAREWQKAFSAL